MRTVIPKRTWMMMVDPKEPVKDLGYCKCSYYHCCDWIWSAISCMGYCTVGMGGWTSSSHGFLLHHLLHIYPSC
ncbi:hypothetical protein Goshw_024812 [Gossypium schwendimanii]|uniref:Uncharacterized protein n=1 Tax=Gossypium schwendimanii TaxID=34291 RepID=A0A7J9N362_GOSSC|nr:hypothetical protein [Gossypium schwendimanii]